MSFELLDGNLEKKLISLPYHTNQIGKKFLKIGIKLASRIKEPFRIYYALRITKVTVSNSPEYME